MRRPWRHSLFLLWCAFFAHEQNYVSGFITKPAQSLARGTASSIAPTLLNVGGTTKTSSLHEDDCSSSSSSSLFQVHLQDCVARHDNSTMVVEGYVTASRKIGRALIFVDFLLDHGGICQSLLRFEQYRGREYDAYRLSLMPGTRFRVSGIASSTRNPGEAVLMIQTLKLIGLPRQSQHIQKILTLAKEGRLPIQDVGLATQWADLMEDLQSETVDLKALSKAILKYLPEDPNYPEAADQKKQSQKGVYSLPRAPQEWEIAPDIAPTLPPTKHQSISELISGKTNVLAEVSGWVQNRRRFEDNITVLQIVDDLESVSTDDSDAFSGSARVASLLHPELLPLEASLYKSVLTVGSRIWMQGQLVTSESSTTTTTLWITQIRLLQASWRPVTLRHILDLVSEKKFDLEEASEALSISYQEVELLAEMSDATQRQWKAMELSSTLQTSQSRHASLAPELLQVLDKYLSIREQFPVVETSVEPSDDDIWPTSLPGSKWQAKKQPQLVWMAHQIRSVITSHPDYGKRTLHILDIGGGKGLLANYLGRVLENVQIHVADISLGAITNGAMRAKRLQVPVDFVHADAASHSLDDVKADVVVALHACGHLTDVALAHAVQRGAGFVICPCCFRSNAQLRIPNTMRQVVEDWLGLSANDWNALKLIAEVQGDTALQSEATATICAIRAHAANLKSGVEVSIKSFPIQYSTRNICLVGKVVPGTI